MTFADFYDPEVPAGFQDADLEMAEFEAAARERAARKARVRVHHFDSTGEAYNASQTHDDIRDGDVLVVRPEGIVGILVEAWPTVVHFTDERRDSGAFHELKDPKDKLFEERYPEALEVADEAASIVPRAIRKPPAVGARVRLKHDVDRYPHFIAPKGAEGIVVNHDPHDPALVAVRLDEKVEGAEEWENEVHWYFPNGDDPTLDIEEVK